MDNATDEFAGIPGIGSSRKTALIAAGITTRAELAKMTVEQLVSLTGMPRTQAQTALEAVQEETLTAPTTPPPTDDALPQNARLPGESPAPSDPVDIADTLDADETLEAAETAAPETPVLPDDDQSPAIAAQATLDRAALRTKSALADATRVWSLPQLDRSLTRLALSLESVIGEFTASLRPKPARRLATRLDALAQWVERALSSDKPLTDKRRKRLRERLRTERQHLDEAIRANNRRTTGKKKSGKSKKR